MPSAEYGTPCDLPRRLGKSRSSRRSEANPAKKREGQVRHPDVVSGWCAGNALCLCVANGRYVQRRRNQTRSRRPFVDLTVGAVYEGVNKIGRMLQERLTPPSRHICPKSRSVWLRSTS